MNKNVVRILIVDDSEQWRLFASSKLQSQCGFQVIGQAKDGPEAIAKAQELRPDIILLDIGLPELNGMEVARRLRSSQPESKILFWSADLSPEIVDEMFGIGALGYVPKIKAATDLMPAIRAVTGGQRFISSNPGGPSC